jgi:hypothetical protein
MILATESVDDSARYTFLDEDSHRFYPHWDEAADICVAILRTEAGRDPLDKDMHDLVGELSTRSDTFRSRWSDHNVRYHGAGTKHFHHQAVGNLGSTTEQNLKLLASWAATANDGSDRDTSPASVKRHGFDAASF